MDKLCKICERVPFGNITYVGFGHWRHEACAVGSEAWKLYYQRQSATDRRILSEFLNYYTEVYHA